MRKTLTSVRRTGVEPIIDRKTFRIRWNDEAGHPHHIDAPLTPDERSALLKNTELFRRVTRDPRDHTPGRHAGDVAVVPSVQPKLDQHAAEIRRLGKRVIKDVVEIGRHLVEVKELTRELEGHGHWLSWLEREFEWTDRQALNYIRVYEMVSRSEKFSDLNIPVSGFYMVAAPSVPAPARQEVLHRAADGKRLSLTEVREIIQRHKTPVVDEEGAECEPLRQQAITSPLDADSNGNDTARDLVNDPEDKDAASAKTTESDRAAPHQASQPVAQIGLSAISDETPEGKVKAGSPQSINAAHLKAISVFLKLAFEAAGRESDREAGNALRGALKILRIQGRDPDDLIHALTAEANEQLIAQFQESAR
jgi:hypothetical protein